jgi:hypothetical protein
LRARRVVARPGDYPFDRVTEIALCDNDPSLSEGLRPRYRVELCFDDGTRWRVVECHEPAGALDDLRVLHDAIPVPVSRGWGLDDAAVALLLAGDRAGTGQSAEAPAGHARPSLDSDGERTEPRVVSVRLGSPRVLVALAYAVALVLGTLLVLVTARIGRSEPMGPFSIALHVVSIVLLSTVLVGCATDRLMVRVNGQIEFERSIGPFVRSRRAIESGAIRAAFAVGAEPDQIHHILVSTDAGMFALPCPRRAAADVLRAIGRPHSTASVPGMHVRS